MAGASGELFSIASDLELHGLSNEGLVRLPCDICHRGISSRRYLDAPSTIHEISKYAARCTASGKLDE